MRNVRRAGLLLLAEQTRLLLLGLANPQQISQRLVGDQLLDLCAVRADLLDVNLAAAPLIRSEVTGVDLDAGNGGLLFTRAGQVSVNEIKGVYEASSQLTGEQETGGEEEANEEAVAEAVIDIVEETVSTDG